jgi:hypothetical protein
MHVALANSSAAYNEEQRFVAAHTAPCCPRKWDLDELLGRLTDTQALEEFFTDLGRDPTSLDMGSVKARHTAWFYLLRIGLYTDINGDVQKLVGYLLALNVPNLTMPIEDLAHNEEATDALCWLLSCKGEIDQVAARSVYSMSLPSL